MAVLTQKDKTDLSAFCPISDPNLIFVENTISSKVDGDIVDNQLERQCRFFTRVGRLEYGEEHPISFLVSDIGMKNFHFSGYFRQATSDVVAVDLMEVTRSSTPKYDESGKVNFEHWIMSNEIDTVRLFQYVLTWRNGMKRRFSPKTIVGRDSREIFMTKLRAKHELRGGRI